MLKFFALCGTFAASWSAQAALPPVTNGLVIQYDAQAITGLADGATVDTWNDTSGLNNHGTSGTIGAAKPVYTTGAFNGHPVVRFNPDGKSYFTFTNRRTDIRTVFIVGKQTATGSYKHFMLGDNAAYHFHVGGGGQFWDGTYSNANIRNGTTRLNGAAINGTTTSIGTSWFSLSLVTTGNVTADALGKDRNSTDGRFWDGDMAEVLIYNTALTPTQVADVESYLNAKWFTPANTVVTPVISPDGGTYSGAGNATITCSTPGATLYYTTDGSTPTNASPSGTSPLSVPVPAGATTTIQTYGHLDTWTDSTVASVTYTTLPATSSIWTNPAGGSWPEPSNWQGNTIASGATADFSTLDLTADATVTLDGARTMSQLVFGDTTPSHNWQLTTGSGDPLTLDTWPGTTPSITVNNQTATLDVVLAGTKGLTKAGSGTLALTAANSYTGATAVNAGALRVGDLASYRSSTAIASGATFDALVVNNVNASNSYTISGSGTLVKTGAGTWLIGNVGRVGISMSAGGVVDIQEGMIGCGSHQQSWTGNQGSVNIATGATLDIGAESFSIDALTGSGSLLNSYPPSGTRTTTIGVANGSGTFSGVISSTVLALNKSGSGTQILTGDNTYTGATTISGGTLQLGNGGTSGSLSTSSAITCNGTLAFNRSDSISQGTHFSGNAISGSGGLTQMGPGSLTLTTNHSYTGTTAVTGGELSIALAPGSTWNVTTLDLANATTLSLHNFDSTGAAAANVSQSLTTAGTVTLKVSGNFTVGSFPMIYYPIGTSIGGAGFGALVLGTLPDGVSATLEHDPDNATINLNVTAVPSNPFQDWISTQYPSLTGDDALPGADPDGDGMSNLGEFAFHGDPTSGSSNGPTAVKSVDTNANGNKEFTLTVAVRAGAAFSGSPSPSATVDGVSYTIEGSLNLADAFASAVSEVVPALTPAQSGLPDITGSGWEYHSFRLNTSEGLTGKGFMRAKAETP